MQAGNTQLLPEAEVLLHCTGLHTFLAVQQISCPVVPHLLDLQACACLDFTHVLNATMPCLSLGQAKLPRLFQTAWLGMCVIHGLEPTI